VALAARTRHRLTRRHTVDGRELLVLDGVISVADARLLGQSLEALPYRKTERDVPGDRMRGFVANFDVARCREHTFVVAIERLIARYLPKERFSLWRMYCNNNVYGDMSRPHRDSPPRARDVTALLYASPVWRPEWAGETIFYDKAGDAVACVAPRPARVALFRSAIVHRNGVPSRECYEPRLVVALKYLAERRA
jgi:SM-20-related protein